MNRLHEISKKEKPTLMESSVPGKKNHLVGNAARVRKKVQRAFSKKEEEMTDQEKMDLLEQEMMESEDESGEESSKENEVSMENDDLVGIYLRQMGEVPLLKQEQEIAIAKRTQAHKERWQKIILGNHAMLERALDLLKKVLNDEVAMHLSLEMSAENPAKEKEKRIEQVRETVEKSKSHIINAQKAYLRSREPSLSQEERTQLFQEIKSHREQALELVECCKIHIKFFKPWMDEMEADWKSMKKNQADGNSGLRELEDKYGQALEVQGSHEESSFERTMVTMTQHHEEYTKAKKEMAAGNTRLVISVAKRYRGNHLSLLDLIQEGNAGLMKAVERFEWQRGNKFSTFAVWWIRQGVTRAIYKKERQIRIPEHTFKTLSEIKECTEEYLRKYGREPTLEEISTKLKIPKHELTRLMKMQKGMVSLNNPLGYESDGELGDVLEDSRSAPGKENGDMEMMRDHIREAMIQLNIREQKILCLRYGIRGIDDECDRILEEKGSENAIMAMDEVGRILKMDREKIRQHETLAMRKLRVRAANLEKWVEESPNKSTTRASEILTEL
jgi:RNA polymerase primary sigma factor